MIKTILFDMDGTLIDCNADIFIPVYRDALIERFSSNPHCAEIVGTILKSPVAMVANDGSRTNQEAFVEFASKRLGEIMNVGDLEAQVNDFYEKEYIAVKKNTNNVNVPIIYFCGLSSLKISSIGFSISVSSSE